MTPRRLVDQIAELIEGAGVHHVFGVGGANIEDMFAAVQRRRPGLHAILTKHEHGAGTAADAYARLRGGLGVVLATSGGGALNLVHSLAEARASSVPVLAIVGEPPQSLQGHGAFQDTSGRAGAIDSAAAFRAVSTWCVRPQSASEVPALVEQAMQVALDQRGPAVLLLAKDLQQVEVDPFTTRDTVAVASPAAARSVDRAVELLAIGPAIVIAGDQVARARACGDLARLAERLDANVAVTPDALDAFDNASSRFIGVAGAMGHRRVAEHVGSAGVCVLAGTRLPLLARQGLEGALSRHPMVSLGRGQPFIDLCGGLHLEGDVADVLRALLARVPNRTPLKRVEASFEPRPLQSPKVLNSEAIFARIGRHLPEGAVVLVDAGNTGASAAHHLRVPSGGRWLLAMGMAGMGYTFGAAIGAACATGQRCVVCAGDGAFYMHGFEIHTAVEHALPITFIIFNNRAHGMCLLRERLLLREEHQYNRFKPAHVGAGLAAMFPGLVAHDCRTLSELDAALSISSEASGPVVIGTELADVEVPPFAAFGSVLPAPKGALP
jgi:acetolactate synthase I/II/III large subunit